MQIKSVVTRGFPSSTKAFLSLANSFNLGKGIASRYTMPSNDVKEIASHWNGVGEELRIALNEYGKRYDEGHYRNKTKR